MGLFKVAAAPKDNCPEVLNRRRGLDVQLNMASHPRIPVLQFAITIIDA